MHVYAEGHRLRSHGHHCCSRAWIILEEHQSSLALEQHYEVRPKVRPLWLHVSASYVQYHHHQQVAQLVRDQHGCQEGHSETLFSRGGVISAAQAPIML